MKNEEISKRNAVIAKFMGYFNLKVERPEFEFAVDLWQTHEIGGFPSPLDKSYCVVKDLLYHESWNQLMPVFEKLCAEAETKINMSRLNIAFCSDFIHGVWNNDIGHSYNALVVGIEWINTVKNKKNGTK